MSNTRDNQAMGWKPGLVLVAMTMLGCGEGTKSSPAAADGKAVEGTKTADSSPTSESSTRWRFRPTLDANLPQGAVAEPVVELSEPADRSVVILAAVLRSATGPIALERWTYEQIPNQDEGLQVVDRGVPLVRLQPGGTRSPELPAIRKRLAAPGVVLTRPMGLEQQPAKTVESLAAALAIAHDPTAAPTDRVRALAEAVRGVDDTVLLEADALGLLTDALDPPPTEPIIELASTRRASVRFADGDKAVRLDLQRKADGWAVVTTNLVHAKAPAPTPEAAPDQP